MTNDGSCQNIIQDQNISTGRKGLQNHLDVHNSIISNSWLMYAVNYNILGIAGSHSIHSLLL